MKNYVFVFVGELEHELLNWQGVVRKLRGRLVDDCRIVACSRRSMQPFYETADAFVDLSDLSCYRQSVAAGYTELGVDPNEMAVEIRDYVCERQRWLPETETQFVFSFERTVIDGLVFGTGDTHANLDVRNNLYTRIVPDHSVRSEIECELEFDLESEYVLCQTARREIKVRSPDRLRIDKLLRALADRVNVVLLDYTTGRHLDSYSVFEKTAGCRRIAASSFKRQGCLIHYADSCLFFTEGDFHSHIFVPPFLGRNVHAVAPASVYRTAGFEEAVMSPIDFWNANVFRFGGSMYAHRSEAILRNERTIRRFTAQIAREAFRRHHTHKQLV